MKLKLNDFAVMSDLELMEIVKDINDEVHDYYRGYAFYDSLYEFQNEIDTGDISDDGVLVRTDTTVGILYEY